MLIKDCLFSNRHSTGITNVPNIQHSHAPNRPVYFENIRSDTSCDLAKTLGKGKVHVRGT